jgi:hypothetical protein
VAGASWVKLTKGKFALVDIEDYERVADYNWSVAAGQYAAFRKSQSEYVYLHRFIVGAPPGVTVDHINHDGFDNRKHNLRVATQSQQGRNQRLRVNNTTGRKGVYYDHSRRVYRVEIRLGSRPTRKRYLGSFLNLEAAGRAYDAAAVQYFGEFAFTNEDILRKVAPPPVQL